MTALTLSVSAVAGSPSFAADPGTTPAAPSVTRAALGKLHPGARAFTAPTQRKAVGRQAYFVELAGESAADVADRPGTSSADVTSRRAAVQRTVTSVFAAARKADAKATTTFTVSNAVPGAGMLLDAAGVRAVSRSSQVVKVSRIISKTPSNSNVASLVKAVNTWSFSGNTGAGVKIGVIDTGLDYTHADFGGPGTKAAYDAALAVDTKPGWRSALPTKGKVKVAGGHDFVGDDYQADPATEGYQPVPHPDSNPLDCGGHGTHVAGSAAGYGVSSSGKTFTGKYRELDAKKLATMDIGPGMAPRAKLYALKVFGCAGSTDEVIPALDWALDPNGDGDFSDHLDILNLSLGSDYGPADDPENTVIDKLASHGVLSVIAMGNNGDLTDTGGSPGNATSSLAVASSVDALQQRDGIKVDGPASVKGVTAGQMSVAYDWPGNGPTGAPVSGDVVTIPGENADGCDPFSTSDAAAVAGKVVWLEWDDNDATRRCGSVGRSANAEAAGAIGAIFTSKLDVFGAGITGSTTIPVFQLPKAGTDKLRASAEAGTLSVTFDGKYQATIKDLTPVITDTLSSFSSRGPHGSLGVVKPDVSAPGDTVSSASMGTGNQVLSESGTSMATPVTAGVSALVAAAHPNWGPLKIKAAVMNTAFHDLYTKNNHGGRKYAPARVGAGRIDASAATRTQVLAYTDGKSAPVSASFGVVPAPIAGGVVTKTRTVTIRNLGKQKKTFNAHYQSINSATGVTYSVSPSKVTIPGRGSKKVTVTMKVTPSALRHTIDPTMAREQTNVYYGQDQARQFVSDSSGRLLIGAQGVQARRVPVYGAAKPVSSTTASVNQAGNGLELSGTGFQQDGANGYTSIASVLELGATSPRLPKCAADADPEGCATTATDRAGDLRYVGANSNADMLTFGLATYSDWADVGSLLIPYVDYDVDGDGTPDFETYAQNIEGTDLLYAWTVSLADGSLYDLEPVNLNLGDTDTNVFDTNVLTMTVFKEALPTGSDLSDISYTAGTYSGYYGTTIDSVDVASYDAVSPSVTTPDPLYLDDGGSTIPLQGSGDAQALVLHLHGATGHRAEVVDVPPAPLNR